MDCIVTFDTTHMALYFEKSCRSAGLKVKIVPVPRNISSSCGLACSYPCEDQDQIISIVADKAIDISAYHKI